jgi:hypothetical protein
MVGDVRTRRLRYTAKGGQSIYVVEQLEGAPTFSKGDGKDEGRNLLAAALIGPMWRSLGYVQGTKGTWAVKRNSTDRPAGCYATVGVAAQALVTLRKGDA